MPAFIPLLEKVREYLTLPCAIEAISRNLRDELDPTPHFELFNRLLRATRKRGHTYSPKVDNALIETNLVYFYGHFLSHAFAMGALFATELMVPRRASSMALGLERLGLNHFDMEFMTVHAKSDIDHARDWLCEVIVPELSAHPELVPEAAAGIALRLETSDSYLDRLLLASRGADTDHARQVEVYA